MPSHAFLIRHEHVKPLKSALARAFVEDPACRYIFPDRTRRLNILTWIFSRWLPVMARRGAAYTTAELAGAALWLPPGAAADVPLWELVRSGFATALLRLTPAEQYRGLKLHRDAMSRTRQHAQGPHWILDTLGVSPDQHGKGIAGPVMTAALEQADAQKMPAFVLTHKPDNVGFYQRFGFVFVEAGSLHNTNVIVTVLKRYPQHVGSPACTSFNNNVSIHRPLDRSLPDT